MKKLYFVESVMSSDDGSTAVMLYIPKNIDAWVRDNRDFRRYIRLPVGNKDADVVREGEYVYMDSEGMFEPASDDRRAYLIGRRYEELLEKVSGNQRDAFDFSFHNISELYSYHVNVGHGNHSLLVFQAYDGVHVWMIDCSDYDRCAGLYHRYRRNEIDKCLDHIKMKFHLDEPVHIDVVMLTHPHYDHYSGINYYIGKGLIDCNTIVYINLKYRVKSHNYNNLLSSLATLGSIVIPPFSRNSNSNIRILYPDIRNFNTKLSANNISSVYNIIFDGISYFVFPGDLETKGWNLMDVRACSPNLNCTRYYAISHHGSLNGHLRNPSCGIRSRCLRDCLHPAAVPVLMGRDGAFPGIYSPRVLSDFRGRILYSEKCPMSKRVSFLEINLKTGYAHWWG